jgi:Domain of unknown function (DUF4823)
MVATLLAGCYVSNREIKYSVRGSVPVGTAINVSTPEDGIYMEDVYPNSGKVVARKLVAALTPYYPGSSVSNEAGPSGYLIEPKILHWEDRATEWSGKADRVKVSLPLYRSGSLIGSALVTANSSFFTFGGDHPEDLLDAPFEAYAASLAGKTTANRSVSER